MKAHLINKIEEKEVVTTDYEKRLELELDHFKPHMNRLNDYWQLSRRGHLIYPEMNQTCSSLVLHLLDLNPLDPLEYELDFGLNTDHLTSAMRFYCDSSAEAYAPGLSLQPLGLLTDLKVVLEYLNTDLSTITKKVVHDVHVYDFIEEVLHNNALRSHSYFLQETTLEHRDTLYDCKATSFDELVRYVRDVYLQVYPQMNNKKYLIAEIYMDILLLGWMWWLRQLKNN